MAGMARIEEISLGDVVETARRYRPVLAVAAVVFVAALILPAAPRPGGQPFEPFAASEQPPSPRVSDEPSSPAEPNTPPTTAFGDSFTFTPSSPSGGGGEVSSGDGGGFVVAPSSGAQAGTTTTTTAPARPLRTTETGWASATGGTPLGSTGVPDQSLPVGNRFGQLDKASFVRLAGSTPTLYLKEHAQGQRTTSGDVAVRACQITTRRWKGGPNQTFDQAPDWDATNCIPGRRSSSGVWSFDLRTFADPTDDRGFALVPAAGASIDFQVAFQTQAVDG